MSLFEKVFGKQKKIVPQGSFEMLTAYTPVFSTWDGSIYESDMCRCSIDAVARHVAKLKVEVVGSAQPSLQTKLRKSPNSFQTWSQFMYRLATILYMQNTAFVVPMIDRFGDTTGVYPILPSRCEVVSVGDEPWLRYTFSSGQTAAIELSKVGVMTRFQYSDDLFGNDNGALSSTISLIDMQNQGISEGIKNSATYRFMAKLTNFSKVEDMKKERERFSKENFSAESNAGGLLLFPNTYTDIKQIEAKPYMIDANQMNIIKSNVYSYFGVNEDIIQNKAFGDNWAAFYEGAVEPFAIQFSEVMTKMLFTPKEQASGSEVMATSNRIQYASTADKLNITATALDRGLMTINEIRDIWQLTPLPGGDKTIRRGEYKDDFNEDGGTNDATTDEDEN